MSVPDWAPATDTETVVWEGQPRERVVWQGVAAGVVAALVVLFGAYLAASGGAVPGTLAAAVGVPLALLAFAVPAGGAWLWRWANRYVLTDAALYHRTGVLVLSVTELRLGKIQNTSYSQGILGTVFGHGTVTVDTAGSQGAELTLRQLDGPQAVHQRIAEAAANAKGERDDEIPGSLADWKAVRAEVRRIRAAVVGK
ncbi:PH domain-containing protein [Haloarcula onubensis]|uniref:PH domain-containing protein n=1 Tax=Haloarcula onubensis TaxID=2950539 RepID=A0ABU2FM29_9EURY|nr:PH domain-containing protein [Halomicroarcula sp. S3CR25-11]MDS0281287.1 PH domain-containing protein [Halomicroarcula sp. S3CR25-11]